MTEYFSNSLVKMQNIKLDSAAQQKLGEEMRKSVKSSVHQINCGVDLIFILGEKEETDGKSTFNDRRKTNNTAL